MSNLLFFLLLAVFYAIELFVIGPVDGINDDWGMYSILSGAYTGMPDAHVMFFLYPLSWLLSKLYSLCSFIPWFGLFLHGVQTGSLYAVYQRTLRIRKRRDPEKYIFPAAFILFLFLFFIINLNVLSEAQYTTTAGVAAAAALFCFITARTGQTKAGFFSGQRAYFFVFLDFLFHAAEHLLSHAAHGGYAVAIQVDHFTPKQT